MTLLCYFSNYGQNYIQETEVLSSGGGASSGSSYNNFGVIGETFVDFSVTGGNYITNIGFLYASDTNSNGIDEKNIYLYINIYPNPNSGEFVIEMEISQSEDLKLKLFNLIGQVIYEETLNKFSGVYKKRINLSTKAKGVYTLKLISAQDIISKKIVIE